MPSKKQLINDLGDSERDADMHRDRADQLEAEVHNLQESLHRCQNGWELERNDRNTMAEAPTRRTPSMIHIRAEIGHSGMFLNAMVPDDTESVSDWIRAVVLPQFDFDSNGYDSRIELDMHRYEGHEIR